jgi:acetyl esterase
VGVQLVLRERGEPLPGFQLLTYPALDPKLASASYRRFAEGPFLTKARMAWYWEQFLGSQGQLDDLRASPLEADLTGFPPSFIQVAECDVLRDDGLAYAERLRESGVDARVREHAGMIHGFIAVAPAHRESRLAMEEAAEALRAHWQRGGLFVGDPAERTSADA